MDQTSSNNVPNIVIIELANECNKLSRYQNWVILCVCVCICVSALWTCSDKAIIF